MTLRQPLVIDLPDLPSEWGNIAGMAEALEDLQH